MIDVDGFKRLNDLRGHVAGDGMLKAFAQNIKKQHRQQSFTFGGVCGLAVGSTAPDKAACKKLRLK